MSAAQNENPGLAPGADKTETLNSNDTLLLDTAQQPRPGLASAAFEVRCRKSNGTAVVFDRYARREEAEGVVAALARVGCSAFVEGVRR